MLSTWRIMVNVNFDHLAEAPRVRSYPVKLPFVLLSILLFFKGSCYAQSTIKEWGVMLHSLRVHPILHQLFEIPLHSRFGYFLWFIYLFIQLFVYIIMGWLIFIYWVTIHTILKFLLAPNSSVGQGELFQFAPGSLWQTLINVGFMGLWALSDFLKLEDMPRSSYLLPAPGLESAISSRSHGSFDLLEKALINQDLDSHCF